MCSVKVDVVGVDPLAAVENLEGDDVVDVVGFAISQLIPRRGTCIF